MFKGTKNGIRQRSLPSNHSLEKNELQQLKSISKENLPSNVYICTCGFERITFQDLKFVIVFSIRSISLNISITESVFLSVIKYEKVKKDSKILLENFIETLFQIVKTETQEKRVFCFLVRDFTNFDKTVVLEYAIKKNYIVDMREDNNILSELFLTNLEKTKINLKICFFSLSDLNKSFSLIRLKNPFNPTSELK
jgi:hypothetical protein